MNGVIIIDFGSQYTQLIARRIRECNVFCVIFPYNTPLDELIKDKPKAIILSGGPATVTSDNYPNISPKIFKLKIPILGICYGMQLIAKTLGGEVESALSREYGRATLIIDKKDDLFYGVKDREVVWMSHADRVKRLPPGFEVIGHTKNSAIAAMRNIEEKIYGVQFHPEVAHTKEGIKIIDNFLKRISGCENTWQPKSIVKDSIEYIKETVGGERVICAVSGGVDSTVLALLLHKAIGKNLICIFVNNGLLRKGEPQEVISMFKDYQINLVYVDATDIFLEKLKGIIDPEQKRKVIAREFIKVFEREAMKLGNIKFLAQGTLYPDVVESRSGFGTKIKTHHNVGGLPSKLKFVLIEPFRLLFKDEVRKVGEELGLPERVIYRQPFPGPGLAVRIIGEVTKERLNILREADYILQEEARRSRLYKDIWQIFAVLLPIKSVGIMGDERTYENVVAIRAVTSKDGMTADWVDLPHKLLGRISNRIINEVRGINRVVYDISSKPPATIEWE